MTMAGMWGIPASKNTAADCCDNPRKEWLKQAEILKIAVELGHTDTDATTCLSVPEIGLVVAGDAVYNDVHLHLGESSPQVRREWLAALDTIESLHPRAVIAGHQRAGRHDGPEILEETRQYIRDLDQIVQTTATARELYDQMLALYPERINSGALWSSAQALKG